MNNQKEDYSFSLILLIAKIICKDYFTLIEQISVGSVGR